MKAKDFMEIRDMPLNMPCSDPEGCKHFKDAMKATERIEELEVCIECAIEDLKAWHCLSDDIQKRNIERFVKDFENTLKGK